MIDIQLLRKNIISSSNNLARRNFKLDIEGFQALETRRREIQTYTEKLQKKRNVLSKRVASLKRIGDDTSILISEVNTISNELKSFVRQLDQVKEDLDNFLLSIPNISHETVPVGNDHSYNVELYKFGIPRNFNFRVRDHVDLGMPFGVDFNTATKITGARFVILKGKVAHLHRALTQFMLDIHCSNHGYIEHYVPYIVNADSLRGTGQLPKFSEELFSVRRGDQVKNITELYLIPTAEVPLTNIVRDEIIAVENLPIKMVAHSPCFRSEAGSYGRDTRGMIRQHQFDKIEIMQVVHPEESYEVLDEMVSHAENILKMLKLPYRLVSLCTGDIGFGAAKTYDLEVWIPSQNTYREVSSVSNFEAFQARRLKARFRKPHGEKELVHTLNGSGLAVGRTLVALLENFQQADGSVEIPEVLHKYMGGITNLSI